VKHRLKRELLNAEDITHLENLIESLPPKRTTTINSIGKRFFSPTD